MNEEYKKAYKVVYKRNFSGFSSLESVFPIDSFMNYGGGEWAERPCGCGSLCCFKNKDSAVDFIRNITMKDPFYAHHLQIWACYIKESPDKQIWSVVFKPQDLKNLPKETVLADEVKLIERIY